MRRCLMLSALLMVAMNGGASAQPAKECDILKRALYGDKIIDGAAFLAGSKVPADLLWPIQGAQANAAVGKGTYSFYFHYPDAQAAKADALFAALDKQVAQCLPSARRGQAVSSIHAYCLPDTRKIVNIMKSPGNRFVEVLLSVNVPDNKAQACR